ncbi:MAG: hypothetical protein P1P87_14685 [Trueperaceae bacterium]|nr:hypothetical protein [Trueperaceae bacterium]
MDAEHFRDLAAPIDAATSLVNEPAAGSDPIALVLDDYHLVDVEGVRALTALLVEHAPPRLHVVVTTRTEPDLPIARMRARSQVLELRAEDLRFDADEATSFLTGSMGLAVTAADAQELHVRTEGWVAGLQLAALSLHGREDAAAFVRSFAGGHRYVVDYLTHEVLARQPERVRAFLLAVSVLDRLCGPLCDALTGDDDGTAMLAHLERAHLFLVPLDDERRWYRFHAPFADALRAEAERADGGAARRSTWRPARGHRAPSCGGCWTTCATTGDAPGCAATPSSR